MAEYNPSKIIKDGNTYNFRDTTKIPLAGSNQISGSLIPSTDGTVNLGSVSYQWNNAYIKSLTINGVAAGDILTHNASEFVKVTGAQTVAGVKTFSGGVVGNVSGTVNLTLRAKGGTARIFLRDNSAASFPNTVNLYSTVDGQEYGVFLNGNAFHPISNDMNLGISSRKWKSVNGINPGALSLPSISSTGANAWIVLDTTDWVKNTAVSLAQKYTPLADGWLNVRVDNATMLAIDVGGNYMHQIIRSETANSLALLMPVFKNTEVAIMVGGNENLAYNRVTFYYCQGNV